MTYTYQAEFCDNCKRFAETYEVNDADPGTRFGYSTSGPYCAECNSETRSVNWCESKMYEIKQVYDKGIPF